MSFRYPKSRNFNAPSRMGSSGRTAAAYSLGRMGSGFGSISRIYNFCHNNTGNYSSAIQCVFGIQSTTPTPPTPPPTPTIFYFSDETTSTTLDTVLTQDSYNYDRFEELVSVTIGTSCTSIGFECFIECVNLASVSIPNSVTSLGESCFNSCYALILMTIPSSVTSLGDYCFGGCNFTSMTIPNSVTSLGKRCFYECDELTSMTIPDSVASIGLECFRRCYVLSSLTFNNPNNITQDIADMLSGIGIDIYITFYNTANWDALNQYVKAYFLSPNDADKPSNWFYEFVPPTP